MSACQGMSHREWVLLLLAISLVSQHGVEGRKGASTKDLELERHLQRLNKPAIKTIHSEDGDIIDCVDIYKQPAFDHPALKNHTIKMRPSSYPKWLEEEDEEDDVDGDSLSAASQVWRGSGSCPEGTIPIRRVQKQDLLRSTSPENYGKKYTYNISSNSSGDEINLNRAKFNFATMRVMGELYGGFARISVWNPQVEQNDFSNVQIWITNGPQDAVNAIEVGWAVYPNLYGDRKTRFSTYWTGDGFRKRGCFNLLCAGFVQRSAEIVLGAAFRPTSIYQGMQYDISLLVFREPSDGNWWLVYGENTNKIYIGYWPHEIFTYLAKQASWIEWGGVVYSDRMGLPHTTTQMGNGHFPTEYFMKACLLRYLQVVDSQGVLQDPVGIKHYVSNPNCYDIWYGSLNQSDFNDDYGSFWGHHYFYVGGPGRNPKCP